MSSPLRKRGVGGDLSAEEKSPSVPLFLRGKL